MNRTELVNVMSEQSGLSKKDCEAAVKAFVDTVTESLKKKEPVQLIGFGTFDVTAKAAREGRNPSTGETIHIAASNAPRFKAGASLKKALNE